MADRTSKLNLQYIVANQSQKEVTINADLNVLDMLVQATAKGIANAPPASPAEGEMYIIGDAPTGTWEGKAKHLAGFFAGVWHIVAPRAGWRVWLEEGTAMRYQDGRWTDEGAGLDDKAPLASPALTGKPTTPTAAQGANDTQIANTAFVAQAVATLVNSAPETLDTLQELAKALNNDPNFTTTMLNLLAGKVNKSGDTISGNIIFTHNSNNPYASPTIRSIFPAHYYHNYWSESNPTVYIHAYPKALPYSGCENKRSIFAFRVLNGSGEFKEFSLDVNGFHGNADTATNAEKLGNMTLTQLLAEVDRRIAAKHP